MIKLFSGKEGNVLIISVAALVIIFMMMVLILETGNFMYEKVHIQNIADSGALEGGTWYARGMNIVSISNNLLLGAGAAAALMASLGVPGGDGLTGAVQKTQNFIVTLMPAMSAAMVIKNGQMNGGVASIPLFNVENFEEKGVVPSFNIKRVTLAKTTEKKTKYFYRTGGAGVKNYVDERSVEYNKKAKRWQMKPEYAVNCKRLFVSREISYGKDSAGDKADIKLGLAETGEHTVLVVSVKQGLKPVLGTKFLKDKNGREIVQPIMVTAAMARVYGGNTDMWDFTGAAYKVKIENVILPAINIEQLTRLAGMFNVRLPGPGGLSMLTERAELLLH